MSLKQLAKGLAKINGIDLEQEFKILKQRQRDIEVSDYFTAFVMDKIRQEEENKKLGGNENE